MSNIYLIKLYYIICNKYGVHFPLTQNQTLPLFPSLSAGDLQLLIHRKCRNLLKSIKTVCPTPANILGLDSIQSFPLLHSYKIFYSYLEMTCSNNISGRKEEKRDKRKVPKHLFLHMLQDIPNRIFQVLKVQFKERTQIEQFTITDRIKELLVFANFLL